MNISLRRLFAPSEFVKEDQINKLRLFWIVLAIVMVANTIESIVDIVSMRSEILQGLVVLAVIDGSGILLFFLSKRGYVHQASMALIAILWTLTTWLDITEGGIFAPTLDIAYLVIIVAAGLLLGEIPGIIAGVICSLSMFGFALTATLSKIPPPPGEPNAMMVFLDDLVFVVIIIGLQSLSTSALKGALNQAHQEILERRRTEVALQQAKSYAENLIQGANAIVIGIDRQGQVTLFNQAAEKVTGYTREELAGKNWLDISVPRYRFPEMWELLHQSQADGYPRNLENPIQTKSGEERYIVWQNTRINDEVVSFGIDITEQKNLQQERLQNQAKLEVQRLLAEQREEERLKIARDLHDGPVQELVGATFTVKCLIDDAQDESLRTGLQEVQTTLQKLINSLRVYAGELRPPSLMKFGLEQAIRSHLEDFQDKHPEISVQLDADPAAQSFPEEVRLALFRIYQESMNNIVRHAHATQVTIRLSQGDQHAGLEIQDNGVGFTTPTDWMDLARQKHLGLVGMRERVEAMRGKLRIISEKGKGTKVQTILPLEQVMQENQSL